MKSYDPGDYTPSDEELEDPDGPKGELYAGYSGYTPNALWNYGPEGAPTLELENVERTRRSLWRMIDHQLEER